MNMYWLTFMSSFFWLKMSKSFMHLNEFCWFRSQECLILFWTKLGHSGHKDWGLRFLGGLFNQKGGLLYIQATAWPMSLLGGAQVVFFFFWENMHKYVIQQRYSKVVFFLFKDSLLLQIHQYDKWLRKRHTPFQILLLTDSVWIS